MADESNQVTMTRRQAVAALGAGVVLAGGAAAVAGVEATNWAKGEGENQVRDLQAQLGELAQKHDQTQKQLAAAQLQIEIYKGLGGLYDTLDKIGIDSIVGSALGAYKTSLDALDAGVKLLREGIVSAENALDSFENTFALIRGGLDAAEKAWANINALFKNVQELVGRATNPILPLLDQATRFFDDLLSKIPFGAGEGARQTLNGITGLIVAVPGAVTTFENELFRTLRDGWFSDDNARNLEATLAKPISEGVLAPARKFLDQLDATLKSWEGQVAQPVNNALSQRAIVQKQIEEYKTKNGLA